MHFIETCDLFRIILFFSFSANKFALIIAIYTYQIINCDLYEPKLDIDYSHSPKSIQSILNIFEYSTMQNFILLTFITEKKYNGKIILRYLFFNYYLTSNHHRSFFIYMLYVYIYINIYVIYNLIYFNFY